MKIGRIFEKVVLKLTDIEKDINLNIYISIFKNYNFRNNIHVYKDIEKHI